MGNQGWANQANRRLVVVEGSAYTGLFFYEPTAAAGNLVGSWTAEAGTDPYGNAYPAGINVTIGTISGASFMGTNFVINDSGVFLYNGTPATGNLIGAIADGLGTDPFGNAYLGGFQFGPPGLARYVQVGLGGAGNEVSFWTGFTDEASGAQIYEALNTATGGTSEHASLVMLSPTESVVGDASGVTATSSSADGTTQRATASMFYNAPGGSTTSTLSVGASGVSANCEVGVTVSTGNAVVVTGAATGQRLLGTTGHDVTSIAHAAGVTGEAFDRLRVTVDGEIAIGPGTATRDAFLARTGAGSIGTTNGTDFSVSGQLTATAGTPAALTQVSTDTWHTATPATGWTQGVAPNPQLSYKLTTEASTAWVVGSMTFSGTAATGQLITTLPVGYRPSTAILVSDGFDTTNDAIVPIEIAVNGNVTVQRSTGANPNVWMNCALPLNLP